MEKRLPILKEKLKPDIIIANGENLAHGIGLTRKMCEELFDLGVHCITTGNHVWDKREIIPYIDKEPRLLRPLNYPDGAAGKGKWEYMLPDGRKALVINAMGRLFMDAIDDPFRAVNGVLKDAALGRAYNAIFIDFHAETTSEKMSLGHYVDGRVSAVVGTHTHIPTADHRVLKGGTAYMSDLGMTGDYDSVIGVRKDIPVQRFVRKVPGERMEPADGEGTLCGAFIVTDDKTGFAQSIVPVRIGPGLEQSVPEF